MKLVLRILVTVAMLATMAVVGNGQAQAAQSTLPQSVVAIATDVIDGTVTAATSVDISGEAFTVYTVEIASASKGSLSGSVDVATRGGTLDNGDVVLVMDQPILAIGMSGEFALIEDPTFGLASGVLMPVGGIAGVNLDSTINSAAAVGDFALLGSRLPSFPAEYQIDGTAPGGDLWNAIAEGVDDWGTETCSGVSFQLNGAAITPVGLVDGVNAIGPVATGPSETFVAQTHLTLAANSDVVEWDIRINFTDHSFAGVGLAGTGVYDLATVVRHEVGEVLGLGIVAVSDEIMYSPVPTATQKPLGDGDKSGIAALYPIHPFTDVNASDAFEEAVAFLFLNDITEGSTTTTFSPEGSLTRAEMATFFHRLAGEPAGAPAAPFIDVPAGSFYDEAVDWLADSGITQGTSATEFSPTLTLSRKQIATFLYRYAGSPAVTGTHPFTDVVAGQYYSDPITWLYQSGYTTGVTATTFEPDALVPRSEMAQYLWLVSGSPSVC